MNQHCFLHKSWQKKIHNERAVDSGVKNVALLQSEDSRCGWYATVTDIPVCVRYIFLEDHKVWSRTLDRLQDKFYLGCVRETKTDVSYLDGITESASAKTQIYLTFSGKKLVPSKYALGWIPRGLMSEVKMMEAFLRNLVL